MSLKWWFRCQLLLHLLPPSFPQHEPQVKSRPKATYADKATDILMTQGFLPEDKDSLHNTGIPAAYAIRHSGTSGKGRSLYMCPSGDQCSSPPYVSDIASTGSHVHRHHLGHCIKCPYDGSQFYNGTGWWDHMSSKHEGALWYHSQLGIDCKLPSTFFKATTAAAAPSSAVSTISDPDSTQSTGPSEATIPVSAPLAPDVPETDTLEHILDAEDKRVDEPNIEPESSSTKQGIDIESLTIADLKEIIRFLPSDL